MIGKIPKATPDDIARATAAADTAFTARRTSPPRHRARLIHAAVALLRSRSKAIAQTLTLEQGKPLAESLAEVESAAQYSEWYAEEALRMFGHQVTSPDDPAIDYVTMAEPIGPTLILVPWNFPLAEAAVHVAPALAAGCSVILKPPEETPGAAMAYVQPFIDAGAPKGLLSVLTGEPGEIAEQLISDPRIRRGAFTGSVPVGKKLAALVGLAMKRRTMELGGDAPVIIDHDADLDRALPALVAAKFVMRGRSASRQTDFSCTTVFMIEWQNTSRTRRVRCKLAAV